jgi:hypothetical protein
MLRVRRVLGWALFGAGVGFACGGPQPLGKSGEPCVRAADCAPGLVCVEGLCSSDLSDLGGDSSGPALGGGGGAMNGGVPQGGAPASGGAGTGGAATGGTGPGGSAGSQG